MIKFMIQTVQVLDDKSIWPILIKYGIENIQTAEAEREMYLEDHPDIKPDNVHVIQYRE